LELHLELVILQQYEAREERGKPVFGVVHVECALEVAQDVSSKWAQDAMDDDGSDLVVKIGRGGFPVIERIAGVVSKDRVVS